MSVLRQGWEITYRKWLLEYIDQGFHWDEAETKTQERLARAAQAMREM